MAQVSTLPMQDVEHLAARSRSTRDQHTRIYPGRLFFNDPFISRCLLVTLTTQLPPYTSDLVVQGVPTPLPSTCVTSHRRVEGGEGAYSIPDQVTAIQLFYFYLSVYDSHRYSIEDSTILLDYVVSNEIKHPIHLLDSRPGGLRCIYNPPLRYALVCTYEWKSGRVPVRFRTRSLSS